MTALKIVAGLTLQMCETKAKVSSTFLLWLIQFQGLAVVCSLLSLVPPGPLCSWAGNYVMLTRVKKKKLTTKMCLLWCVMFSGMRGGVVFFSKFRSVFWCGSSHCNIGTAEGAVEGGRLRNMQGKLPKLLQLLEETFSKLWLVSLFKTRFLNDAVFFFWVHFGWKVLRVFLRWTKFQTFGSCR